MSATRFVTIVFGATLVAFAATSLAVGCKNGDYDGSYDGSFDGGSGSTSSRVVQPDTTETVASTDGVLDVTFGPGTFAKPATITVTSGGEQTLDTGLVVPIFAVSSDQPAAKFFQVSFHGSGNSGGGQPDRALVPTVSSAGAFTPLAVGGTPNGSTGSQTYWGLTQAFGTYSLAYVSGVQSRGFADTPTSCTGQCCHPMNGNQQLVGFASGCFCNGEPDLACYLQHCSDLAGPAARCAAIGAANNLGTVACKPFGVGNNCPGAACPGYAGRCGNGGGGGINNFSTCCVINKNSGTCVNNTTCAGFSARCTADTKCPASTTCCVFETESYCAADCPAAQRACSSNADCTDAGADAGTCQGGACPVAVCGTPPGLCQ